MRISNFYEYAGDWLPQVNRVLGPFCSSTVFRRCLIPYYAKDIRLERGYTDINGALDIKTIDRFAECS
ncbi:MAG: hypothetical protein ACOX8Q_01180 [Christensenellales bacterium]